MRFVKKIGQEDHIDTGREYTWPSQHVSANEEENTASSNQGDVYIWSRRTECYEFYTQGGNGRKQRTEGSRWSGRKLERVREKIIYTKGDGPGIN